jgi:ATP-dependent DNA ligase
MALETLRTLGQLKEECEQKGITVQIKGSKEHKEDYIRALRDYWLEKYYGSKDNAPWALKFMLSIDCPMLCRRYQQCKPEQQKMFWESDDYIAEEKINGNRSLILFDASTQEFDFYSRNNSVKDYLPQSYKDTIYVTSKDFHYPESFVLDCEVISTNPNISTVMGSRGVVCATQLQATTALLALNPLESKSIQRQYPLKFIIFDCLYDGEDLIDQPWKERHPHAEKLARLLKKAGFSCDLNPVVYKNKLEFYSDVIEQNKEGIIFKNKNAPYHACTSRTIDQVKLKRTISDGLNKDLDAWVSGFIPSDPNKSWSNLIGALVFSCKVRMKDGSIKDHIIGTCSGISLEFRKFATIYVDGKPSLNPDLFGKVATLSGQNISARKLALTHAVIQNWRPDKNPEDCEILEEEELLSMVF